MLQHFPHSLILCKRHLRKYVIATTNAFVSFLQNVFDLNPLSCVLKFSLIYFVARNL